MRLFKKYSSIRNFLYRFTILKFGNFHIRIHNIKDIDRTNFYHSHPFDYISIILFGGYEDEIIYENGEKFENEYNFLNIIKRKHNILHRITSIKCKNNITLFIAYNKYPWSIINENVPIHPDGIFLRNINGDSKYYKRKNDIYYIGHKDINKAINETRFSIHQYDIKDEI